MFWRCWRWKTPVGGAPVAAPWGSRRPGDRAPADSPSCGSSLASRGIDALPPQGQVQPQPLRAGLAQGFVGGGDSPARLLSWAAPCSAQGPAVGPVQAYYVPDTEPVQEPVGSAKTTVLRGAAGHRAFLDVVPALAPQGGRRFRFAAHKAAETMGNAVPGRLPSPGGWGKGVETLG